MRRREFTFAFAGMGMARPLRVAAFRADVTPALGEPLIWVDPTREVLDPLWAKGVVIEGPGGRVVLCAVDWCGLGGYVHRMFREKLAQAVTLRRMCRRPGCASAHRALRRRRRL